MKKMRDEAIKSPGKATAAAGGASNHSFSSPTMNTEMNNAVSKQNSSGKDDSRTSDGAAAAAARHGRGSDLTGDPSMSETLVSCQPYWRLCADYYYRLALCGLRGCKNRAHSVSWPEVVKAIPNQGLDCFVS